jgi:hypothetical protein
MKLRYTTDREASVGRRAVAGRPTHTGSKAKWVGHVGGCVERTDASERYRCEACGETFESDAALERHLRAVGLVD